MGATFCTMSVPANLSQDEVRRQFRDVQDQDRHENGHTYSGGFGMASGLRFMPLDGRVFGSVQEAEAFLQDACVKWEVAKAVKHKNLDGTESYLIGAWCAS